MKLLVVHSQRELYERIKEFCEKSPKACFRGLEIEYAKDTNMERTGTHEFYVQKMEHEGPEWIEPDEEVLEKIADAHIVLTEWGGFSSQVIGAGKKLKMIATIRSGAENINVEYAREHGISVSISPSRLANAVADMTVALMLSECRGLLRRNLRYTKGIWVEEAYNDESHSTLSSLKVGLAGYGGIARVVARRLVRGFGCEVLAYEQITPPEVIRGDGVEPVDLETLCRTCDIISLHARLVPETEKMFGRKQFELMKPNAIFINTARAGLMDEEALIEALRTKKIRGAGLDVYTVEPLPLDSPLLRMDNVTLMPHSAGITNDMIKNSLKIITTELERFLTGEELKYTV
ncbi:MAG: 2-hydroxyacid dehydrogenase [Lachnospiraceae bacterium]|jgi:D-3-phosphoglycerate dehydrogenase|nr:2-hydroxyacid dehydrogenase [Lachnospiraceae bacterium]